MVALSLRRSHVIFDAASRLDPTAVKAEGGVAVCRYICQVNALTTWKIITPTEFNDHRNNGVDVLLNYEWYAGRPLEPGTGRGDGLLSVKMAQDRGYEPGRTILYSVDTNAGGFVAGGKATRPSELPYVANNVIDFYNAIKPYGYKLGVYGGGWLIRWLIDNTDLGKVPVRWWQAVLAWSNAAGGGNYIPPEVHLLQRGQMQVGGKTVDINNVQNGFLTLDNGTTPPIVTDPIPNPDPTPTPQEEPVLSFITFSDHPEDIFIGEVYTSAKSGAKLLNMVRWIDLTTFNNFSAHLDTFSADAEARPNLVCVGPAPDHMQDFGLIAEPGAAVDINILAGQVAPVVVQAVKPLIPTRVNVSATLS